MGGSRDGVNARRVRRAGIGDRRELVVVIPASNYGKGREEKGREHTASL